MRQVPIDTFLVVPRLTAGRRQLALQRLAEQLEAQPALEALRPAVDEAIEAQRRVLELRAQRPRQQEEDRMHALQAVPLDAKLDRAVAALHGMVTQILRGFDPTDTDAAMASRIVEGVFPHGVASITQLPYVDQHAAVDHLVRTLRGDAELARAVTRLGLDSLVERIDALNVEYGQLITRGERITAQDLRDADREGWLAMCTVVAQVLGAVSGRTDDDEVLRGTLLRPILEQQQEIRKLRARRAAGGLVESLTEGDEVDPDELEEERPGEPTPTA